MKPPAVADLPALDSRRDDAQSVAVTIIRSQPVDASLDDILRALGFHRVVERGLADAKAGRVISQENFRRKLDTWLG